MEFLADGLLVVGSVTIAVYCFVLSRRLSALSDMDSGLGQAIGALSDQVGETRASLKDTCDQTEAMVKDLASLTARAEIAAGRLELLLATVHDGKPVAEVPARDRADADDTSPSSEAEVARRDVLAELQKIAGKSGR